MKNKLINTVGILLLLSNVSTKAQWQPLSLTKNQSCVQGITFCNNTLFTGVSSTGILASKDNGKSWQTRNNGITVEQNSIFPSIVFSDGKLLVLSNVEDVKSAVYESSDHGNTWNRIIEGLPMKMNENYTFPAHALFSDGNKVYASLINGEGIYCRATDEKNWKHVAFPRGNIIYDVRNMFRMNDVLFALTKHDGIYASSDNGVSWKRKANVGLPFNESGTYKQLDMLSGKEGLLFTGGNHGLYISGDHGDTWSLINEKVVRSLIMDGSRIIIGAPSAKAYYSDDNGFSWTEMSEGLGNITPQSFLLTNENLYATHATNGITKMNTGQTITGIGANGIFDAHFSVFPNPATFLVKMTFNLPKSEILKLKITDVTGKEVYSHVYPSPDIGTNSLIWSTEEVSNGIYFIQLQQGNSVFSEKVTVSK